jgi:uncharacterized membrane protein HdeD (DUF308 family)
MLELLTRNWWMLVLRGVAALLFGILAFTRPGITLGALVLLFGVYALVDGVLALIAVFARQAAAPRWMLMLEGIVGLAAAAAAFFMPGLTAITLLYLIACWAMLTGILEIVAAIALRKQLTGEFWLILSGIASFVFGLVLVARPGAGAIAVIWLIGGYAIVFGFFLLMLGLRMRGLRSHPVAPARPAHA